MTESEEEQKEDFLAPRVWHEQQEEILRQWSETASCYRYLHDRAHRKFRTKNMWFTLPIIMLSTITGAASFAQSSFPVSMQSYVPIAIGTVNLVTGMLSTVKQFLQFAELSEGHRGASLSFGKLSRNIKVELALPHTERSMDGTHFLKNSRRDLDRLLEQSPAVPLEILLSFEEQFKEQDFCRPEIMAIYPVSIYHEQEARVSNIAYVLRNTGRTPKHRVTSPTSSKKAETPLNVTVEQEEEKTEEVLPKIVID